jgi:integrase
MVVKLRYVTARVDASGKRRWYWQRRGHKLTRLPDNPIERMTMAEQLNAAADSRPPAGREPERGTLKWVIGQYHKSDRYQNLSTGSKALYKKFLRDIEALGPDLPFASFTRRAVVDFIESYETTSQRHTAVTALKNLFKVARYHGLVAVDETTALGIKSSRPRERIWTDAEVVRWTEAAAAEDRHMMTAFLLLQYTAQRPGDVLKMTWPQYSGSAIRLRQQKTGALLDVPVHPVLREYLDGLPRSRTSLTIVAFRDRPVRYLRFNERFRRIAERAEVDSQARDLRRTAMLRMAEAGATVPQIASVSGHSITTTQGILETYLPRNRDLAEQAITKLAEYKRGSKV